MRPIVQRLSFDCHREKQSTEHSPSTIIIRDTYREMSFSNWFFHDIYAIFGCIFGAVYAKCMLQNNAFAIAMHAAIQWSDTMDDIYETNRLQKEHQIPVDELCAQLGANVNVVVITMNSNNNNNNNNINNSSSNSNNNNNTNSNNINNTNNNNSNNDNINNNSNNNNNRNNKNNK
ncbi:hypothetical protein DINM_007190 [Dirofilaria immitis]|nr:hypothetical protein [Dirofilaria immitis]